MRRADRLAVLQDADARRVDEDAVTLPFVDDLGIARYDIDAAVAGGGAHRRHDAPQVVDGEAFLQDEGCGKMERTGAAHREVVHRSVHGERSDVAAREEEGPHDIGVRGEGDARRACSRQAVRHLEHSAVMSAEQEGIRERRQEDVLDELMHQPATAPVGLEHTRMVRDRDGTAGIEAAGHGHTSCGAMRR